MSAERYALNELQQAVLDVLAERVNDGPVVARDKLLEMLLEIPGHDDVTANGLAPCLAALKRRGLVAEVSGPNWWRITGEGMSYVDQEEGEEPAAASAEPATTTGVDDEPAADPRPSLTQEQEALLDITGTAEDRPAGAEPGECLGGLEYPPGAEQLLEIRGPDRVERPIARGLDLLLAQEDLASRHDVALQGELLQVLKGLVVHTNRTRSQLPPDDPRVRELGEFASNCLELADQVATSLIVPGRAPGEVAA